MSLVSPESRRTGNSPWLFAAGEGRKRRCWAPPLPQTSTKNYQKQSATQQITAQTPSDGACASPQASPRTEQLLRGPLELELRFTGEPRLNPSFSGRVPTPLACCLPGPPLRASGCRCQCRARVYCQLSALDRVSLSLSVCVASASPVCSRQIKTTALCQRI